LLKRIWDIIQGSQGGEREGRERGEEGEMGGSRGREKEEKGRGGACPCPTNQKIVLALLTVYSGCAPSLFQTRYCSADKCTNGPRQERSRVPGTKFPGNE